MRPERLRATSPVVRARGQLMAGLRYARRVPGIWTALLMMAVIGTLADEFQVVLPLLATSGLHGDARTFGYLTAAMGVGAVFGGLGVAARGRAGLIPLVVVACCFAAGLGVAVLVSSLRAELVALAIVGVASTAFLALGNTTLQLICAPPFRGRVMALWAVTFLGSIPIGGRSSVWSSSTQARVPGWRSARLLAWSRRVSGCWACPASPLGNACSRGRRRLRPVLRPRKPNGSERRPDVSAGSARAEGPLFPFAGTTQCWSVDELRRAKHVAPGRRLVCSGIEVERRKTEPGADDHEDALDIATSAGALLITLRRRLWPCDPGELGRLADRVAGEHIVGELVARRPDDDIRSEGMGLRVGRASTSRMWIVDPLDGTLEYAQGRDDWGVNVALAIAGQPVAAAIALPERELVLTTSERWEVPRRGSGLRMVVSRSHTPAFAVAVAARLGASLRMLGSVAAKAALVFSGEAEIYLHAGGMFEWDSAAAVALAGCCGMHASRLGGGLLRYARPDPRRPDLLICRPKLAQDVLDAVAPYLSPPAGSPDTP